MQTFQEFPISMGCFCVARQNGFPVPTLNACSTYHPESAKCKKTKSNIYVVILIKVLRGFWLACKHRVSPENVCSRFVFHCGRTVCGSLSAPLHQASVHPQALARGTARLGSALSLWTREDCPRTRRAHKEFIESEKPREDSFSVEGQWAFSSIWLTLSSSGVHKGRNCLDTVIWGKALEDASLLINCW